MNQVWLITGSGRGLGRAIAEAALAAGNKLIATARDPQQLSDLVERYSENVRAVALDVTDEGAAIATVQLAVDTFGRLDVLVNNAGYGNLAAIEDTTTQDFRAQVETNLFGVVNLTKAAIPVMRRQESGRILAATVGAVAQFQREYDGVQPGDPIKAAAAVLKVASLDEPPLRLLLGRDAVRAAAEAEHARATNDRKWRTLSESTDFIDDPDGITLPAKLGTLHPNSR